MASKEWKIRESILNNLLFAAKRAHPNEFFALLSTLERSSSIIAEVVVIPAVSGRDYAGLYSELVPIDPLIVGTVHSHPSPSPYPSDQDLMTFSRMGEVHLIMAHPYTPNSVRAFDARGKNISFQIV